MNMSDTINCRCTIVPASTTLLHENLRVRKRELMLVAEAAATEYNASVRQSIHVAEHEMYVALSVSGLDVEIWERDIDRWREMIKMLLCNRTFSG